MTLALQHHLPLRQLLQFLLLHCTILHIKCFTPTTTTYITTSLIHRRNIALQSSTKENAAPTSDDSSVYDINEKPNGNDYSSSIVEHDALLQYNNKGKSNLKNNKNNQKNVVIVVGFESFNTKMYQTAAAHLTTTNVQVFSDQDIRKPTSKFREAMQSCDMFIASLIFDYDDCLAVADLLERYNDRIQSRLIFESATELMKFNQLGSFNMISDDGVVTVDTSSPYTEEEMKGMDDSSKTTTTAPGPPPAVKAIISKFSSGKEEDKLQGYLQLLKFGPDLLQYFPGDKVADLKSWLEAYRYWNQGGARNFASMLELLQQRYLQTDDDEDNSMAAKTTTKRKSKVQFVLPELEITPDIGQLHPLYDGYFESPAEYLKWRLSLKCQELAQQQKFQLAPSDAPRVAVLLYRKHVITAQSYIPQMLTIIEQQGLIPIPIFINGVEAHTIVRDLLTSNDEMDAVKSGNVSYESTYQRDKAVKVDAIVSTIGFPLVGGPAGSMQAGRNIEVAKNLLQNMNVPYIVAAPLLLQDIPSWRKQGVQGLQSVVLYSLPELDGSVDSVVLGGLVGDVIALVPERVRKLCSRIQGWITLRQTPVQDRTICISIYGFPPNVGAVGTAALLDVPHSLEQLLHRLSKEGYNVGDFATDPNASGESLVAALAILSQDAVIAQGAQRMQAAIDDRITRAQQNHDPTIAATLAQPGGGLGGATVRAFDINNDDLEDALGKYMYQKVHRAWGAERGPSVSSKGDCVVSGLQLGNVWITVQPLLGVEGDPMRMLFERDLTPHRQYCAAYEWMKRDKALQDGAGIGAQAVIHLGMHGTVEWLPGLPLGNDRASWPDALLGNLPNIYVYAANNPSESILAKRRGYGTLISYNVPPYGRAGLYLELANLKDLISEFRTMELSARQDMRETIYALCNRSGLTKDVPLIYQPQDTTSTTSEDDSKDEQLPLSLETVPTQRIDEWILSDVSDYLVVLQDRLFSSGLHVLGSEPTEEHLKSYLKAYFGDDHISDVECDQVIASCRRGGSGDGGFDFNLEAVISWFQNLFSSGDEAKQKQKQHESIHTEAQEITRLLLQTTQELDSVVGSLNGGYVLPAPGGDLLRDGSSVLPTGRNIHALDPYRMPSAGAWLKGQRAAEEIIRQHRAANDGAYPETVAVTLWGLDAIKTRGESVAIALALVGAEPIKEGTGRIVRFDLRPLDQLNRPRIDVLASLSGIFRDSFANIVDLLDDLFERAAEAPDEPADMNFIKKHAQELKADGVERPAARLFSNPPGDYGSMVNEVVGSGEWEEETALGETWRGRNVFSYGRGEGTESTGTARPEVLDKLLSTTERIVQEIDSVEYGLTDIQEYYANTGALKKAAENRRTTTGNKKNKVAVSIIEAFGGGGGEGDAAATSVPVQDLEQVLRIEYRSKLLNPKWRDAMIAQGSGGAYEVSQRMTAMVGWAATADVDHFVFDQAAERYALDDDVANQLRDSNPEAFKNVVRRLLEAQGRGYWDADEEVLEKLRELYSEADDLVEQVAVPVVGAKKNND